MIKSKRMRWEGHVARLREKRNACRILVGKPEGKRPLGKPRRSGLIWLRIGTGGGLLNTVMNLWVPNFLSYCTIGSFSRRAQLHE
jgi:hypothetical protein